MNAQAAVAAVAIAALMFSSTASMAGQTDTTTSAETKPNTLYWQGHEALGRGDWSLALQRFADLERHLRQSASGEVDAAIYWEAYALMRAGRSNEAEAAVKRLRREYPRSRWNGDAAQLLRQSDAATESEVTDEGVPRLEALMSLPAARAIPKLVVLLQGDHSVELKKRALFVLSQMNDPGALVQIAEIARGADPALGAEAVRMLGISRAANELRTVYAAVSDPIRQQQVLEAMGAAGAEEALAEIARSNAGASLRGKALEQLGITGNVDVPAEIAGSNIDLETRREAIKALGLAGGLRRLLTLYPKVVDVPELRDEVLNSLLLVDEGEKVLLRLHREAKSPEEKQAVLRVLSKANVDD